MKEFWNTIQLVFAAVGGWLGYFLGGCDGNHKGLAALAEGMTPEEAAKRMRGITCGPRDTSCPDQLAIALEEFLKNQ